LKERAKATPKVSVFAVLEFHYEKAEDAEIVAKTVSPDNLNLPKGLSICTALHGKLVKVEVVNRRGIASARATLDDLISSIQLAEATLQAVKT